MNRRMNLFLLEHMSKILFIFVLIVFGLLSDKFLTYKNFLNIFVQTSHLAILATGMMFVLLLSSIDISVGAIMYLCVAVVGAFFVDSGILTMFFVAICVGAIFGFINAMIVLRFKIVPFIATLATFFIGRALALTLTETRLVMFPMEFLRVNKVTFFGIHWTIWCMFFVIFIVWIMLNWTRFGRYLYAIGANKNAAQKSGIPIFLVTVGAFTICGLLAGLASIISISQVGAASTNFGLQKEFAAISAAVLGGTSLFGGRGNVFGVLFGAILIQMISNGLGIINANPYIYPLITALIIFIAVLADSQKTHMIQKIERRKIRIHEILH